MVHFLRLTLFAIACVCASLCGGVSVDVRCPSNMTLRHDESWTACTFPHILTNQRGCGRPRNETWDFRLCDPDYMFTFEEGWSLEEYIRQNEETTPYTCNNKKAAPQNYTLAVAVVKSIAVPDLTSPDVCINDCGAILPKLSGRVATEDEIGAAMEQLGQSIRRQWGLGTCGNDIIILYSSTYQKAYTTVGSKAAERLSQSQLQSLNRAAVDYYFTKGQTSQGIRYLVASYKQILLGFSPAKILLLINMGLLMFVLICLFFGMNLGQEMKVLQDESLPSSIIKYMFYVVSLLWVIKLWMKLFGWFEQKPLSRFAYILLPVILGFLCVLVAWMASPNTAKRIYNKLSLQ